MKIDLGLDEAQMRKARRLEFPAMLRDLVSDGHTKIDLSLDAATALAIAADIEFAIINGEPSDQ